MRLLDGRLAAIIVACSIAGVLLAPDKASCAGGTATTIKNVRVSAAGARTRLIFDAEGGHPRQIGPASAEGVSVFFARMKTRVRDRVIEKASVAAREIKFRRESDFFEVLFREKNTGVTHKLSAGKKTGQYSIVLELTPPPSSSKNSSADAQKEKAPFAEAKRIETTELFGSKAPPDLKSIISSEDKKKPDTERKAGKGEQEKRGPKGFAEASEQSVALFKDADEIFENCHRNLVLCAPEVIEAYGPALQAAPQCSHAPLGFYREGLSHWAMGNYSRAERLFRHVIGEWPDHPVASSCWIGIGDIFNKKRSYIEAMEAFRAALRTASDKAAKAAAYFELGKEFLILGANKEALEMFSQCLGQEPEYHFRKPDFMRFLGEAEFALGMYDKGEEHLLRYLNFQQSAQDQDMVYAKLAEIFLNKGEITLADKMYTFIETYYTDSEGDLVSRIRRAELLEKTDQAQSLEIYEKLCGKDLSPSLRRIVNYKMALLNWKKGDFERALELMDQVYTTRTESGVANQMSALRENIVGDLIRKNFAEGKYIPVVQLHDKYRRIFETMQVPEVIEDIAESYAALKFYSNALELYDRLFAKGQKRNEEILLRCALYSLRQNDQERSLQFCKPVQAEALDLRKSEILAHVFYRDRKYGEAVKYFSKILQKQKEFALSDPDSFQCYGHTLCELQKYDEAVPVLEKGLEHCREDDRDTRRSLLQLLAKSYGELKQYRKAAETMELALGLTEDEQKAQLLYEISKLYLAAGQPDKAVQGLNQIIGSQRPFWTAIAQQQLNSIQMGQGIR